MRNFSDLDTASFRAFYYSAETLNFTLAAKKAALTQSGVSQHVAKLESQLGVPLFLRVKKTVILTEAGKKLRDHIERYLDEIERLKESLAHETLDLKGKVSYAMPSSCLMSPHFGLLLEARRKKCPMVDLGVTICPSDHVFEKLLGNEIDFGFVTKHTHDADIKFKMFCPEEYILVGGDRSDLQDVSPKTLKGMRFLAYPGVEVLFDYWLGHHFPKSRDITWQSLNVVGEINSLSGVIEMIGSKMGVTVIPKHCVDGLIQSNKLYEFRGNGKPLLNSIYIVTLASRVVPRRVEAIMDIFWEMKGV